MLAELRDRKDWGSLINIHFNEDEVADALAALAAYDKRARQPAYLTWGGYAPDDHIRVAAAAEAVFPHDTIRLYTRVADDFIVRRNKGAYAQAATARANVRRLLQRGGREDGWRAQVAALREEHNRLRALQDEHNMAALTE